MIFTWNIRKSKGTVITRTDTFPIDAAICGLQYENHRPDTVTLDYEELSYLLRNMHEAIKVLIALNRLRGNEDANT